jgi:hypothetical protein
MSRDESWDMLEPRRLKRLNLSNLRASEELFGQALVDFHNQTAYRKTLRDYVVARSMIEDHPTKFLDVRISMTAVHQLAKSLVNVTKGTVLESAYMEQIDSLLLFVITVLRHSV